jgi:hypothetical protein
MTMVAKFFCRGAIAFWLVALLGSSLVGYADTYKILDLGIAESNGVYGMDTAGDVVIRGMSGCGDLYSCYMTYEDGVLSSVSATAPVIGYDDGVACKPVGGVGKGACNGEYEAFGDGLEVYAGSGGWLDVVSANSSMDAVALNSVGDFAWTDGLGEENYEAIDLTPKPVPEPGTLGLLATGVLGAAGVVRRRLV